MAIFVATDFNITINGSTALTQYITQVELKTSANDVTTTSFGSSWVTRVAGLKEGTCTLQFNQDYASTNAPDTVLWPLLGSTAVVLLVPVSTAVGSANPQYRVPVLVTDYTPISGNIGDLSTFSITWPTNGPVTRGTV
jgi:hypothetical protein